MAFVLGVMTILQSPFPFAGSYAAEARGAAASAILFLVLLLFMIRGLRKLVRVRTQALSETNQRLALENETREAAQQMLRAQRDLAMVMTSSTPLEETFGQLLARATALPGVEAGGLYLMDESGTLILRVHLGLSERFVSACRVITESDWRHKLVMDGKTVSIRGGENIPLVPEEGLKAILVVPIRMGTQIQGALNMGSRTLDSFPDHLVHAVETMGMQMGAIIERIRTLEALRASEQNYRNLTESAFDAIFITDEDARIRYVNSQAATMTGYTLEELDGLPYNQLMDEVEYARVEKRFRDRLKGLPVPSRYETAIRGKDGRRIPVRVSLRLSNWKGKKAALAYCSDLTGQKRLEEAVLRVSEWEKNRIGHDLHDSLGQQLTGILYFCKALEEELKAQSPSQAVAAARLGDLLREAVGQLRRTVRGLAPVAIEEGGFEAGMTRLASETEMLMGIACRFENEVLRFPAPPEFAAHLYHLAQEAVNNAVRHGGAKQVLIRIEGDEQQGMLVVVDDGVGFDPVHRLSEGSGLRIMHYRADLLGGRLTIERNGKGGMTIRCTYDMGLAIVSGGRA